MQQVRVNNLTITIILLFYEKKLTSVFHASVLSLTMNFIMNFSLEFHLAIAS